MTPRLARLLERRTERGTAMPKTDIEWSASKIECPECRAEKHGNCNGDAWDNDTDEPVVCFCYAWGHQREE